MRRHLRIAHYAPRSPSVSLARVCADALAVLAFLLLALRVVLRVLADWHAERAEARRTMWWATFGRVLHRRAA